MSALQTLGCTDKDPVLLSEVAGNSSTLKIMEKTKKTVVCLLLI